jgi:hypothetical protein
VATSASIWGLEMPTLIGSPVTRKAVESRLNLFNRSGGDAMQASFAPGAQVGETDMTLHVVAGRKFRGVAQIDNHGLRTFGQERLAYRGSIFGLANMGDRLDASVALGFSEKRQIRGHFAYTTPLVDKGLTLSASVGVSDIQWRDKVEGRGTMLAADVLQTFNFTRASRRELRYQVGWQDLSFDGVFLPDQKIWFANVVGEGHQLWDKSKTAVEGRVGFAIGGNDNPYDANNASPSADQDDRFWRVHGDVLAWKVIDHPWFEKAVIRSRFQYTGASLPASQQVSLSRPTNNPGLYPHTLGLDSLVEVGAALYFTHGHWWVFVDSGYGEVNDRVERSYQLTTAGIGWQTELYADQRGRLSSRIVLGHPLVHKTTHKSAPGNNGDLTDDGPQLYWSIRFDH